MNSTRKGGSDRQSADVARLIASQDCDANLKLAQKTRRAVRDAVISTQEKRAVQRKNLGFAILGFVTVLVLLAPAIWNGMEDLLDAEHLSDLPELVSFIILMVFSAMLAALIAVWKGQQDVEHDRGGLETFRSLDK
jgi:hypothetical protein